MAEDSSSDFSEDVGERGGYYHYQADGSTLTVTVQEVTADDSLKTTVRSWRLVPLAEADQG